MIRNEFNSNQKFNHINTFPLKTKQLLKCVNFKYYYKVKTTIQFRDYIFVHGKRGMGFMAKFTPRFLTDHLLDTLNLTSLLVHTVLSWVL